MSHEQSYTVKGPNGWVNIPGVFKGKSLNEKQAVDLFRRGMTKPLGGKVFPNEPSASNRAMRRSTQSQVGKPGVRPPGAKR